MKIPAPEAPRTVSLEAAVYAPSAPGREQEEEVGAPDKVNGRDDEGIPCGSPSAAADDDDDDDDGGGGGDGEKKISWPK